MLRSSLYDYSDACILVKGTIKVASIPPAAAKLNNNSKEVVFENYAPFTDCISKINNSQIDIAKCIDLIMPRYNLIECSNNYSKRLGSLWEYYRDELALPDAGTIKNFRVGDNDSALFKFKQKIAGKTADGGTKDVEIMVSLKYLSKFWRTLEIPLINCIINFILTWSDKFVLSNNTKATAFAITDTKLYVLVVTLSTRDNAKLLEQLKLGFKGTINSNIYDQKLSVQAPNPYLDFLINPSFQGVNRIFVLSFENEDDRAVHTKYYLPTIEIKNYNVMIDGRKFFDQTVKNNLITYHNIAIAQGDDYTTDYLLD